MGRGETAPHPLSKGLDDRTPTPPPTPSSQGLDPALQYMNMHPLTHGGRFVIAFGGEKNNLV